jgi:WD40 repeat protein
MLQDYRAYVLPNALNAAHLGHTDSVKCVGFVEHRGAPLVATGSSDCTLRFWRTDGGNPVAVVAAHSARLWDLSSGPPGPHARLRTTWRALGRAHTPPQACSPAAPRTGRSRLDCCQRANCAHLTP